MFTQCPDCDTAFRVTAEVLKQAAGMVRCGGCGNAFNALEYLTETKPKAKAAPEPAPDLPELTPESFEEDASSNLPKSISAEQSAALLKTLDQLAGSDIRIEDTGVEWRVVDEEQESNDVAAVFDEPGETAVDELLEEAPTPVDQFLTATPDQVEAGEIFDEPEEPEEVRTSVDELRFDDNTPLPDDFDLEEPAPAADIADEDLPEAETGDDVDSDKPEEMQVDLEFGEADAWESLLDEVEEEIAELEEQIEDGVDEPEEAEEAKADVEPDEKPAADEPPDMDTQFAIQAEALGIDLSGVHETGDSLAGDEMTHDVDLEALLDDEADENTSVQKLLQTQSLDEETLEEDEGEQAAIEAEPETEAYEEPEAEASDELVESLGLDLAAAEAAIEASTSDEYETLDAEDNEELELVADGEEASAEEFELPPLSEEEQTINMQIDQDLLAIAVEDEDGFASTIIKGSLEELLEEEKAAEKADKKKKKKKKREGPKEFVPGTVETIIMEGESVRSELDSKQLEADEEILAGIRADSRAERDRGMRGGRRWTDPPSWGKIAAALVLVLVLIGQVVHQSREALATNSLFVDTFGPLYRMIGRPLTPAWDISGWRIEKSKGNFDESGQTLTIETQIRNKSGAELPYPLIGVALTDRFEETIGHRILEPGDYLGNGLDPRKVVVPENTFIASFSIDAPSAEATGFNLKVCYRLESGQLRCAIEDFK
jgi:predicted Zn finger-like uncharacterized protein